MYSCSLGISGQFVWTLQLLHNIRIIVNSFVHENDRALWNLYKLNFLRSLVISYCNFFVQGSFTSTGLVISSKLPRFSDLYTLTISSSDPKSISANEPVQFTKSVTRWSLSFSPLHSGIYFVKYASVQLPTKNILSCRFTKDGVLVEGLFWKDVEALIDDYAREPKKSKWFLI